MERQKIEKRKIIEPLPELFKDGQWIKIESNTPAVDIESKKYYAPYDLNKTANAQRLHEYGHILYSIPKNKFVKKIKDPFLLEAINYIEDLRINLLLCYKRVKDIEFLLIDKDIERIQNLIELAQEENDPFKKSSILMFLAYVYLNTYILFYESEGLNNDTLSTILKMLITDHLQKIEKEFLGNLLNKLYRKHLNKNITKKLAVELANFYRPVFDSEKDKDKEKEKKKHSKDNPEGYSNLSPYELQGEMELIKLNQSNYINFKRKPAKSDTGYKIKYINNYLINKRIFQIPSKTKFKNKAVILFDISGSMSFNEELIKELMIKYKENLDILAYHGSPKTNQGKLYEIAINGNLIKNLPSTGEFNLIDLKALKYVIDKYKKEKRLIIYFTDENFNGIGGKKYEQIDREIYKLIKQNNVMLINPDRHEPERIKKILEKIK